MSTTSDQNDTQVPDVQINTQVADVQIMPPLQYQPSLYERTLTGLGRVFGVCGMGCCCGCCCECCCVPYKSVQQGSIGMVTKFGRFDRQVDPGLCYVNPVAERMEMVDMRLIVLDLDRQHVTTSDNLSVSIDCILGYRITDVQRAKFAVKNVEYALKQFTFTTLRHIIGNKTLQQCLESRDRIAHDVRDLAKAYGTTLGVDIESIGFRDMVIPVEIQNAISSAAIARRNAEAKIISAEADVKAAELMKKASDALNTESAMQIRVLQTLESMSKSQGAGTRTFVIPMDMSGFGRQLVTQEIIDSK